MRRAVIYIFVIIAVGIAYGCYSAALSHAPANTRLLIDPTEEPEEEPAEEGDSISTETITVEGEDPYVTTNPDSASSFYFSADEFYNEDSLFRRETVTLIDRRKVDIEDGVTFHASDSLVMYGKNNAHMFGQASIDYTDLKLKSHNIRMDMDSSTVWASGRVDSLGKGDGFPVFADRGGNYESKTMKYNFKTQRGYITDVVTEQGEGYLTGGATKKMEDGTFYVEDGKYTTCDDHDHPHFYFQLTRAKVTPKKNIVTGPAYMVLADVPLPIALPFGFFPFSKEYSSGVIFPSFGDDYNRGFYLRDGGYYFAISDYVDLALRGEIYTKGSWGLSARSSYSKRYKFNGAFDISYITTITGDKGAPDYSKQNNFRLVWTHNMDSKANPNMSFSAAVNFATSGYTRNDLNSYYNNSFTENTKSSTVNMTYRFPASKWSLSTTANITQRTQDSTLAVSFPNVTVTMSQTAPFKRKKSVGGERWYEKIKMSYSGQFQNSLTAGQDEFFKKSLVKDWRNGFKHYVPISATFQMLKYINVSPSVTLNDRMYTSKIRRQWDTQASREVADTAYGFYNLFDFSASVSMDTKVYGFWKPLKIFGDKVQMIRHVLTPTVSFSFSPDFGAGFWGYYGNYSYENAAGEIVSKKYNYFSHGAFGSPSSGKIGSLNVALANNLEMKVRDDSDTTGMKKISLIENFSISQSYNFAADSMRWSPVQTSILLRLTKNFNLSLSATWDPYMYGLTPSGSPVQIDKLRIAHGGFPRLSSTGTSFSYTFNNDTFRRKKGNSKNNNKNNNDPDFDDDFDDDPNADWDDSGFGTGPGQAPPPENTGPSADVDGYYNWQCPWSLTFNYSVNYGYGAFNYDKLDYDGKWTQNLSLSGNIRPTSNWNFSFSASYNFDTHKLAYMNCSISRDLHCFTMTASFVPVGPYKSYNFHIAVKSSMLKDLKWDKRSSRTNGIRWY